MEVWTHMVDDFMVTTYTKPTEEAMRELKKRDDLTKVHVNRYQNGVTSSLEIPYEPDGPMVDLMQPMKPVSWTRWKDIQKAAQDARDSAAKEERIAERRAQRRAAAEALRAAVTANKLGLDPKSDRIFITDTVLDTVAKIEAGGETSEGEPTR